MNLRLYLKQALANLMAYKLRSLLAVVGVLVGTASVVALLTGGELATQHALSLYKNLGTDLLSVEVSPVNYGAKVDPGSQLTLAKVAQLQTTIADQVQGVAPYINVSAGVSYQGQSLNASLVGADQQLLSVIHLKLANGRFVSPYDGLRLYCVIGDGVARDLRKHGVFEPISHQIDVGDQLCTIVGVLKSWVFNPFVAGDLNNSVIMPISAVPLVSSNALIQNIVIRLKKGAQIDALEDQMKTKLAMMITTPQRFYFASPKQLIATMTAQKQTFTIFLGVIGGISLLVGGIGVMNIMLVSVTERRREIGIRMAIGATGSSIQLMFLCESIGLTLFGGVTGILIGELISFMVAKASGWQFHILLLPPLIGFGVSVISGIVFGVYPARKAAKLEPIKALQLG